MSAITPIEIEGIRLRSITSWKRVAIATALAMLLAYISGTLSGAHLYWRAFSAIMGMCGIICMLFALASIAITMYYEYEARDRYDTSLFERTQWPFDRFVIRDVLKS